MHKKSVLLLATAVVVTLWIGAENTRHAMASEPGAPAHMSLVRQLGADSFARRQSARKKLLVIGIAAKPALIQGMQQDDLEIRLGSHRILVQVLQNDFDGRIAAFLDDRSGGGVHDLPGWRTFRDEVGDNNTTRHLYADMLRAEHELIEALGRKDAALEQMLVDRIQFLMAPNMAFGGRRSPVPGATLATILLIGTQSLKAPTPGAESRSITTTTSRIASILNYPNTSRAVLQGAYSPQIKKLLGSWIDGIGDSQQQFGWSYAMQLALKFDLRERGPRIARKVLENPGPSSSSVPYAAIVLGRFGTVQDAQRLEPHLTNTQVFHTWSNTQLKKEPIRIQVRDAVLAIMIRLHGEDPSDYGFKLLQADEQMIYKIYTMGFLEDSQRDAAFAKWKAHISPGKDDKATRPPNDPDPKRTAATRPAANSAKPAAAGESESDLDRD